MYACGNVKQLNSLSRWKNNDPSNNLSVQIGIDQNGEPFMMDIHEKANGPHGLVAGTTGSGKSEWIITYILSLAVNFSPDEVQFVLIDYKGGGLAKSFENAELKIKLPHLAGTITNLDKSEIFRSISAIESELKRRQSIFNDAREKLKQGSMDIYKYQQCYRKGQVSEPMSHLLIVCDEFAELKQQEPEFMEQLISTSRIGRSLGVHLILATQKPTGVVNDQIWSNSKFKVALKVQTKSDSNEILKKPDAAYLKQTGAFYLQVGTDEYFNLGQSAWAGAKYYPSDYTKHEIDQSVQGINEIVQSSET
jgi:S-DNA-T family DNA segregation ATPase FtsK/SpoIIIE